MYEWKGDGKAMFEIIFIDLNAIKRKKKNIYYLAIDFFQFLHTSWKLSRGIFDQHLYLYINSRLGVRLCMRRIPLIYSHRCPDNNRACTTTIGKKKIIYRFVNVTM